nr:Ig-like domain-containing protein [uncultured Treponema sp.]
MKFNRVFYIIFFLSFSSCNFLSLNDETVVCSLDENCLFHEEEFISFNLSGSCNHYEVEDCISIIENGISLEFECLWINSSLKIKPKVGWKRGKLYQVSFEGNIKIDSQDTNILIVRNFYFGNPLYIPELINDSISYPYCTGSSLKMEFSKPMNRKSIEENLIISPSINYEIEFDDENKNICILPKEKWKANTVYKIRLKDFIAADNYSFTERELSFIIYQNNEKPEFISAERIIKSAGDYVKLNENNSLSEICEQDAILIKFSKPMDFDSIEKGISITPYTEGYLTPFDRDGFEYLFIPESKFQKNKQYEIKIENIVMDLDGIRLRENKKIFFTPKINYLKIIDLEVNSKKIKHESEKSAQFVPSKIESTINNAKEISYQCSIMVNFNSEIKKEDYKNTVDKIRLNLKFPMTAASPVLKNVNWLSPNRIIFEYGNITPSKKGEPVFYELKIMGGEAGIKNIFSEYLENDICVYLEPVQD